MTAEGDVQISDDTIHGLGTILQFLTPFFGTLIATFIAISQPPRRRLREEYFALATDHPLYPDTSDILLGTQTMPESNFASAPASELAATFEPLLDADWVQQQEKKPVLIAAFPQIGYFVAGGLAGIVSRTTTAPLDRLKVYLIAQIDNTQDTIQAAKSGAPVKALRGAWRTSTNAMKELWAAGGMRSLFAGMRWTPKCLKLC